MMIIYQARRISTTQLQARLYVLLFMLSGFEWVTMFIYTVLFLAVFQLFINENNLPD